MSKVAPALSIAALLVAGCAARNQPEPVPQNALEIRPPVPTTAPVGTVDDGDRILMARAAQSALETTLPDHMLPWRNQDNGHSGTVVPGAYYQSADGRYCRAFLETDTFGGATQQMSGKACRQPDGTWQAVAN